MEDIRISKSFDARVCVDHSGARWTVPIGWYVAISLEPKALGAKLRQFNVNMDASKRNESFITNS